MKITHCLVNSRLNCATHDEIQKSDGCKSRNK